MSKTTPVQVRLSLEKRLQYEDEAAQRGLPLSTYLRKRLEDGDRINESLAALRIMLVEGFSNIEAALDKGKHTQGSDKGFDLGMMVETVLSLRKIIKPLDMNMIHKEVKRQGLKIWNGKEGDNNE